MGIVFGIFAHPDDEAFGPGGTLALLAQEHDLYLVCCTDGNHQEKGLKTIRNKELVESAQILGAQKVFFLDFEDGWLCNANYHLLESKLRELLDKYRPETIITFHPNGVSGHIDHVAVTSVTNYLYNQLSFIKKIMYYAMRDCEREKFSDYFVYMPEGIARDQADLVMDVTPVWDTKLAAMKTHISQEKDLDRLLGFHTSLPREEYFLVRSRE